MQRIFKYGSIQNTSLPPDRAQHFDVWNTFLYVIVYGNHKLLKWSGYFGPPCRAVPLFSICVLQVRQNGEKWPAT